MQSKLLLVFALLFLSAFSASMTYNGIISRNPLYANTRKIAQNYLIFNTCDNSDDQTVCNEIIP